jgi:hypothetical protein
LEITADSPNQGAKIRGTYVKWVAGERKRLEDELEKKRAEVLEREVEVERARSECQCECECERPGICQSAFWKGVPNC